jgi:hypothetical protein
MIEFKYNGFVYQLDENYKDQKGLLFIKKTDSPQDNDELYHYYALNNNGVSSLVKSYIYANHPEDFNDPYDCGRDLISYEKTPWHDILELNDNFFDPDKLKKLYESNDAKDKQKLYDHLNFIIYNVIYLKVGIFCLTSKNDSIEMWSYYTNHRGFVLKFKMNELPSNYWGPFPINYAKQFDQINYSIFKKASFIYQSNIKASCWEPENESRIIFYGPNMMKIPYRDTPNSHTRKFYYDRNCLKEIILGYNFFEIHEYDLSKSTYDKAYVTLKVNKKLKRKVLKHILDNKIALSMIRIRKEGSFTLKPHPINLIKQSCKKYILEFTIVITIIDHSSLKQILILY